MSDTKIISYSMVSKALLDSNFYSVMPEFYPLKPKLATLNVNLKPGGCTGCQKKRVEANLFKDFMYVVQALDDNARQRLKSYYTVDKLMINVVNPTTKAVEFKVI